MVYKNQQRMTRFAAATTVALIVFSSCDLASGFSPLIIPCTFTPRTSPSERTWLDPPSGLTWNGQAVRLRVNPGTFLSSTMGQSSSDSMSPKEATPTTTQIDTDMDDCHQQVGLYRSFANAAIEKLESTGWLDSSERTTIRNQAPAKGFPPGSVVHMQITTLKPNPETHEKCPIQYARMALLETIVANSDKEDKTMVDEKTTTHSSGIQVLNFVIYPKHDARHQRDPWPVWGADFVSLPGGKHLLLLDAQPMQENCPFDTHWKDWKSSHARMFEWGGDLPPPVQKFVSPQALWTRMSDTRNDDDNGPPQQKTNVERIQQDLGPIFNQHLGIYLDLLSSSPPAKTEVDAAAGKDWFNEYLTYRLENDPARPMLKSLYGEEWTEQVLHEVLFPDMLRRP